MPSFNRRNFLRTSGVAVLPLIAPALASGEAGQQPDPTSPVLKFFGDGEMFSPADYIRELQQVQTTTPIAPDRYGNGGSVEALEKKFSAITGKEASIFMPSGTMANQLAIAVLSGEKTKVFVQDTSHVYRDEADAAQSVFEKRLMPLAPGKPFFTAEELKLAIEGLPQQEVFDSGIGAVSIENPVRRSDGRIVPLEEIKKISEYCRAQKIPLHLDGARIYMASVWYGIPVKEYASYFDTVYISLYKYLGAGAGAILSGDKTFIGKMPHLIKIHGGSMYNNWANAAMALHRLEGMETRLRDAKKRAEEIFASLNQLPDTRITPLDGGTNIYEARFSKRVDGSKIQQALNKDYNIRMPRPDAEGKTFLMVNETLLYQDAAYVINAFRKVLAG